MTSVCPPHIAVLSIHPLYDTRIQNHVRSLVSAGFCVTYVNWSPPADPLDVVRLASVKFIHRQANNILGSNFIRFGWMLMWFLWHTVKSRPVLVHIHDLFLLPLVWPLRLFGCRIVFDVHEHYLRMPGLVGKFSHWCYRLFVPFVNGFVGVSESTLPLTSCTSTVVPNYQSRADFDRYRSNEPRDSFQFTLIHFGSFFTQDRDLDLLLAVAEHVLDSCPHARVKFGGVLAGPDANSYRTRLKQLSLRVPERFTWFGLMPREQVVRETVAADMGLLFLKPNTFNLTGSSPNKVFEYLAAGVAFVATDGFLIAEEVKSAGAARLFPAGAGVDAVAPAVIELAADRQRLRAMQRSAKQLGEKYTWESVASRYLELYAQLGVPAAQEGSSVRRTECSSNRS